MTRAGDLRSHDSPRARPLICSGPERLAWGFDFLEGPVWLDAGHPLLGSRCRHTGAILFNDIPRSRTYWWADEAAGVFRDRNGQANGSVLDAAGDLLVCEHGGRRVVRIDARRRLHVVAGEHGGDRLNSPNDVTPGPDGCIYFTDPPYGVADPDRELDFQGVFRVNPELGELTLLADDFDRPNGLAWSADGETLYVADTSRSHVRALSLSPGGRLLGSRVFCDVPRPDGLRVDSAGHLYVASLDGVQVFSPAGAWLQQVHLPERPANLAFGGADRCTLFICAGTGLYRARTALPGTGAPVAEI